MPWWVSGWTYVALVKADGNAGLLLDFLGHRGGGRWSMSSMEVRTSNSNLRKYLSPLERKCGSNFGWAWRPLCWRVMPEVAMNFWQQRPLLALLRWTLDSTSTRFARPSIAGDDDPSYHLLISTDACCWVHQFAAKFIFSTSNYQSAGETGYIQGT